VRCAIVGHVEWVEFVLVDEMPKPGHIAHSTDSWTVPAGGGGVMAVQMARLNGSCDFFTGLGDDELGHRAVEDLTARGVTVHTQWFETATRRAVTHVDRNGERTITTIGPRLEPRGNHDALPWHELAHCDAVYFCAGDADALRRARRAKALVATARVLGTLSRGAVELDALVGSGKDEAERYRAGDLDPAPRLVVTTSGALGGWAQPGGPFAGGPTPSVVADAYGAGDCFAAGLAFALGAGLQTSDALAFAARCGAGALAGRGVHAEAVPLPP